MAAALQEIAAVPRIELLRSSGTAGAVLGGDGHTDAFGRARREAVAPGASRPAEVGSPGPADRRRRILCGALVVLAAALGLLHVVAGAGAEAPVAPERSGQHVVVGPGDTLVSIAREHAGEVDPGEFFEGLVALNGDRPEVQLGQVVALPELR